MAVTWTATATRKSKLGSAGWVVHGDITAGATSSVPTAGGDAVNLAQFSPFGKKPDQVVLTGATGTLGQVYTYDTSDSEILVFITGTATSTVFVAKGSAVGEHLKFTAYYFSQS